MMNFMFFYPILFGFIGRYIFPIIADSSGFSIDKFADLIIVVLVLITPFIYGALIGFSILDDKDDHILSAIKVTPLGLNRFLSFRLIIALVISFIACIYVMWFSDIGGLSLGSMAAISFLASLSAPATGLFINAVANNKIEGFAVMKGAGIIIIFPIIALFFMDKKELFFSFAPGFWPAKAISSLIRGEDILFLSYYQYYFIGLVYVILLNIASYKIFMKRTKI